MDERGQWLMERKRGIGGSDAPAVLGVSNWRTPLQVYLDKRGELPAVEDNAPMLWGRLMEPVIRQHYADVTGYKVIVPAEILRHPEREWMLASLDGVVPDEGRVLEIKTARSADGWGEEGTDEIPMAYLVQVQHYLTVTQLPVADVAVLIGGNDFRLYEVEADAELQGLIVERESDFWRRLVDGIEPEPVSVSDIKLRFGAASREARVQAEADVIFAIERLKEIKAIARREDAYKAAIMAALRDADTLVDGENVLATWKAAKASKRFDSKAFQADHPDLYAEYLRDGQPSRRLLIK